MSCRHCVGLFDTVSGTIRGERLRNLAMAVCRGLRVPVDKMLEYMDRITEAERGKLLSLLEPPRISQLVKSAWEDRSTFDYEDEEDYTEEEEKDEEDFEDEDNASYDGETKEIHEPSASVPFSKYLADFFDEFSSKDEYPEEFVVREFTDDGRPVVVYWSPSAVRSIEKARQQLLNEAKAILRYVPFRQE